VSNRQGGEQQSGGAVGQTPGHHSRSSRHPPEKNVARARATSRKVVPMLKRPTHNAATTAGTCCIALSGPAARKPAGAAFACLARPTWEHDHKKRSAKPYCAHEVKVNREGRGQGRRPLARCDFYQKHASRCKCGHKAGRWCDGAPLDRDPSRTDTKRRRPLAGASPSRWPPARQRSPQPAASARCLVAHTSPALCAAGGRGPASKT
jgi:hypothetical protein